MVSASLVMLRHRIRLRSWVVAQCNSSKGQVCLEGLLSLDQVMLREDERRNLCRGFTDGCCRKLLLTVQTIHQRQHVGLKWGSIYVRSV